jgi:hypothetical protein
MIKLWQNEAWEDYLYWQTQDKKTLKAAFGAFILMRKTGLFFVSRMTNWKSGNAVPITGINNHNHILFLYHLTGYS